MEKELPEQKKKNPIGCIALSVVGSILFLIVIFSSMGTDEAPSEQSLREVSEQLIKERLVDPRSAEFIKENRNYGKTGESTYIITGYVKATNKMGLKAPTEYRLQLFWNGGDPYEVESYTLQDLTFP
jgi:hypothetical protein